MLLDAASSFTNGKGGTACGNTSWVERAAPADDTHTVTAPSVTTILENKRTVDKYAAGTRTVTELPRPRTGIRHVSGCGWFWAWACLGVVAALAAVSFGPILLLPVVAAAAVMARRRSIRRSAFGLLSGVGLLLLYVAYLGAAPLAERF